MGDPSFSLTATIKMSNNGDSRSKVIKAIVKSVKCFIVFNHGRIINIINLSLIMIVDCDEHHSLPTKLQIGLLIGYGQIQIRLIYGH